MFCFALALMAGSRLLESLIQFIFDKSLSHNKSPKKLLVKPLPLSINFITISNVSSDV